MYSLKKYRLLSATLLINVAIPCSVNATNGIPSREFMTTHDHTEKQQKQLPVVYPDSVGQSAVSRILYIPPKPAHNGSPKTRIAQGGTRGGSHHLPVVTLLTPDQYPVLTAGSQPVLYWHLSRASDTPVIVTLIGDDGDIEPLVEHFITAVSEAGVHRFKLADQSVTLQPGKIYEWSVCLQQDEDKFSANDLIARSFIQFFPPDERLQRSINTRDNPVDKADVLARNGFWYDALDTLMEASLEGESEALLNQVGLSFSW